MQSAAGFRRLLAVAAAVVIEMAVMAVMVPAVRGAPVSLDQDLSGGGDRKALYAMHSSEDRPGKILSSVNSPEKRDKFRKILMALEELQRSMNSTAGSRITMVLRGNKPNVRGAGKKNKVVVSEETQRAATLPPVDGGGTVSAPSDRPPEPQNRGGRKSPHSPKKPNKRVCFWKYCSQN
ncbi:urotensin II-related peptide [Anguilla rostrata]|uniref:urotensin II-related peptide n=1 Tax=Anguilla rostrata TaxID=7938 RepID=UPI0030D246AB